MSMKTGTPFQGKAWHSLALFSLLFAWLLCAPGEVKSQTPSVLDIRVTYKADKTPLAKALKDIRTLSNVRFTYNADIIRRQPPVTVDMKHVTLENLLKQVLQNTKLQFAVDLGGIIIYPDEDPGGNTKPGKVGFLLQGQVLSEQGPQLAGVSIRALESNMGTVTGDDGLFSLVVTDGEQLRFSAVGLTPVTLRAKNHGEGLMIVKLKPATEEIKEVVVNGYQRIEARMSTAATFKLDAAQILQPGAPSIDKMLQGKVPGLMILNTSGGINAAPVIRMRGTSTFVGNPSPLWVIDGMIRPDPVPISSSDVNNVVNGNYSLIGSAVSGLNPYDVESITFLRDAAATAIYGTRAANGVIVIQTKRGKSGPLTVSYNTDMSFVARPSYKSMQLMNSEERINLSREIIADGLVRNVLTRGFVPASTYEGLRAKLISRELTEDQFKLAVQEMGVRNTDWFKILFRNSFSMSHSLSLSGGTDKASWYSSLSYTKGYGSAKEEGRDRYTADVRLNANVTKRMRVDMHVMASYMKMNGYYGGVSPLTYAIRTNRSIDPNEHYDWRMATVDASGFRPSPLQYNMLHELESTSNTNSVRSASANFNLSYDLGWGIRFQHSSSAMIDASDAFMAYDETSAVAAVARGYKLGDPVPDNAKAISQLPKGGLANLSNMNSLVLNTRNGLTFTRQLFDKRDQFDVTVGTEVMSRNIQGVLSQQPGYFPDRGRTFDANDFSRRSLGKTEIRDVQENQLGLYLNSAYNLMNKYIVGVTVRSDGSNRFGQYSNAKFLPNYGVSFRWDVSQEKWAQGWKALDRLSFRSSLGTQGNVVTEVGPNLIVSFKPGLADVFNINDRPRVIVKSLAYPDLRWEKTWQVNFGADVSLLGGRINLMADYYIKKGRDLLSGRAVPLENGVDEVLVNAGSMNNRGLELVLNVVPVQRRDWNVSISFVNSLNKNEVVDQGYRNTYLDFINGTASVPGMPVGAFYSYAFKGLSADKGLPLFYNMEDKGRAVDPREVLVYSGKQIPSFFGTVMPEIRYKQFTFGGTFYYSLGTHKRMNPLYDKMVIAYGIPEPVNNASREMMDRWRKPGDERYTNIPATRDITIPEYQLIPKIIGQASASSFPQYEMFDKSDLRVANSSFLRCTQMNLRYTVPRKVLGTSGIKGLQCSINVSNPFTIASGKLRGQDPEIEGVGTTALPITRQYAWSIQATF